MKLGWSAFERMNTKNVTFPEERDFQSMCFAIITIECEISILNAKMLLKAQSMHSNKYGTLYIWHNEEKYKGNEYSGMSKGIKIVMGGARS